MKTKTITKDYQPNSYCFIGYGSQKDCPAIVNYRERCFSRANMSPFFVVVVALVLPIILAQGEKVS